MRKSCIGCVALLSVVAQANAEITIRDNGGNLVDPDHYTMTQDPKDDGWNIVLHDLYNPGGNTYYTVHGNGGETINNLIIDVPCLSLPDGDCAVVGSPVWISTSSDAPGGLKTIHNIEQTGTNPETFIFNIYADQDIGSVTASVIHNIYPGRDAVGPFIATGPDHPTRGVDRVWAGRNILGDILAPNGRVLIVFAENGDIGTPDNTVRIEARYKVVAVWGDDAYADIKCGRDGLEIGSMTTLDLTGTYHGSIHINRMLMNTYNGNPARFEIRGGLEGTVIIDEGMDVAEDLFLLPENGMRGQIIVGAANEGATWVTPIRIGDDGAPGTFFLTGPGYTQTAASLGGGSVGVVPFDLHGSSCSPANGSTVPATGDLTVRLRHYGPVTWTEAGLPVAVERRPEVSTGPFTPVPSNEFMTTTAPGDGRSLQVSTAPGMTGFEPGYTYRITPTTELRCDLVEGEPMVDTWTYDVTIEEGGNICAADLDADGQVGILDVLTLLGAWGTTGADLNVDGTTNVLDLLVLLGQWGPC